LQFEEGVDVRLGQAYVQIHPAGSLPV
jgi:hypothetical protein